MNQITFKKQWFKWALILGIVLLMGSNIKVISEGNYLAFAWVIFQGFLLVLIFTKHKWTKSVLEGVSLLYAILNGFNLVLLVIPLILQLAKPSDDFDNQLYADLILTILKLVFAVMTYQLSKKYIVPNHPNSA